MKAPVLALASAFALTLSLSAGPVLAQTATQPAPPATTAPAEQMTPGTAPSTPGAKKPALSADKKAAISKACSDAADKQGLKGKPRKKFRESCKHKGGPAM